MTDRSRGTAGSITPPRTRGRGWGCWQPEAWQRREHRAGSQTSGRWCWAGAGGVRRKEKLQRGSPGHALETEQPCGIQGYVGTGKIPSCEAGAVKDAVPHVLPPPTPPSRAGQASWSCLPSQTTAAPICQPVLGSLTS